MFAYCMKCKTKREMNDPKTVILKNKRSAIQGVCPVCGTTMFRMLKKQIIETMPTQNPQLASQTPMSQLAPQPPIDRLTP